MELVVRARDGDRVATEALLERCLPSVRRWAHGRLPAFAREQYDTNDLVQDAALNLLKRIDLFTPQHVGAMRGYLQMSIVNRIRDEVRRVNRRPPSEELPEDQVSDRTSPLEAAIESEAYDRYRCALHQLTVKDRELVLARVEVQWSTNEIMRRFGMPTESATRTAVNRALHKLLDRLHA
ncbi:MAG: sigma-70 family RNA polymerase sigma factor [Acidobacteriaceae bacterium]|nr:sigma-70 family RNA polymerase sigma factor [Acidobacteriaceae bacterium]